MGEVNEFIGNKVGEGGSLTEGRRGEGGREETNEDTGADGEGGGRGDRGRQMEEEGREGDKRGNVRFSFRQSNEWTQKEKYARRLISVPCFCV